MAIDKNPTERITGMNTGTSGISDVAATDTTRSTSTSSVVPIASSTVVVVANVHQADLSHDPILPLQINDRCHVKWYGTNPNSSGSARKDNDSSTSSSNNNNNNNNNDGSRTKGIVSSAFTTINLPAIVVERRIARKRRKSIQNDNSNSNNEDTAGGKSGSHSKRQRHSIPNNHNHNNNNNNTSTNSNNMKQSGCGEIPKSLDITANNVKKEMYDTLPADALEYYVHYVDHDRRLDEWVTFDRFQLQTLHRHNQQSTTLTTRAGGDSDDARATTNSNNNHNNNDNIDNNSTDDGDADTYSDNGTVATTSTATAVTRITRRQLGKDAKTSSDATGIGKLTVSASCGYNRNNHHPMPSPTTAGPLNLLSSESEHGNSVFSFHGGNWHAGRGTNHATDPASAAFEREHEETTKVKNIETIVMGSWLVAAWYYSPFPAEYSDVETLYVCEFCLSYMKKRKTLKKHKIECTCRKPPGKEIYRHEDISVYELDGKEHRAYCQKLCLLAKLFLDHKTLYYDVTPFYFYVVTKVDHHGAHIVGYFSKEKVSNEGYNLACILTFPQYQQAGYGKFIISLSYELTKREGKTGSPEKPLSDLGKVSYRSYWTHVLMHLFAQCDPTNTNITMNDMSQQTGIKTEDIISTLQSLDMIKVWKGQHVVYVQQSIIDDYMKLNKKLRLCESKYLKWDPPNARPNKDSA